MAQSNVIAFCLFFAFIVFITLRGEMPKYLDVLFKTQGGGPSGSSGGGSNSGGTGIPGLGDVGNFIDRNTGSDVLGRAATSLRGGINSLLGSTGLTGGIFQ